MARSKGEGSLQRERNGIWTIRYTENGIRKGRTTGVTDRLEAERKLAKWMAGEAMETIRLENAWASYVSSPYRPDMEKSTLTSKKMMWEHFLKWMAGRFPKLHFVNEVTPQSVEAFLGYLRIGHAASTYNNRLCALREIFRVVLKREQITVTPFDGIPLRHDDSHTRRELTLEEVGHLLQIADRIGRRRRQMHSELYLLFSIGIYTGLRLGDCAMLRWRTIDMAHGILQVVPNKTKRYLHNRPVTIPIHSALMELLKGVPEESRKEFVMPHVAACYRESRPKLSSQLKRIFDTAGIETSVKVEGRRWKAPEATFHSLRHTFVSMSANAGVPLHVVQSIVGHTNVAMTRHYYHESESALRAAIAAIPTIEVQHGTPGGGKTPIGSSGMCASRENRRYVT